jgi:hypothetical protein
MEKLILEQYHPILLSKEEVKEIFRLNSDRSLRNFKVEFGLRKKGRHYLAKDVRRAIHMLEGQA